MICCGDPFRLELMWRGFQGAAVRRLAVAAAVGLVVGFVCVWLAAWQLTVLAGWDSAAVVLLAWILIEVMRLDPEQTALHATTEDDSRLTAHLLLVSASSAALMGAAAAFVKASETDGAGARPQQRLPPSSSRGRSCTSSSRSATPTSTTRTRQGASTSRKTMSRPTTRTSPTWRSPSA